MLLNSFEADSILFRTDKRVVYKYPLVPGEAWVSFRDPFLQTREVTAFEQISLGGRTFVSAKIQTHVPEVGPDIEWYDYVDEGGLLVRSIRVPRVPITAPNDSELMIGWGTAVERLELIFRQG